MAIPEITEFTDSLDKLIAATREGKIDWAKPNPTTVVWNILPPNPGRIVIQQIMNNERQSLPTGGQVMRAVPRYLFQLFDNRTNSFKINLTTADQQQLEPKIKALYDAAAIGLSRSGLDFLKSILPN